MSPIAKRQTILKLLSMVFASISMLLGSLVLIGWYSHNISLIQISNVFVPMQYNTALGFFISGIGLLLSCCSISRIAAICGGIVFLVGGLTLVEYAEVVDLGIDQLFMEHYVTVKSPYPGRMAVNTALCFTLAGVTILISIFTRIKYASPAVGLLGAVIFGLGFVALAGYAFSIETAYGWGQLSQMAVHTAFGFILLGTGLALQAMDKEIREKKHLPKWTPLLVAIGAITITISLWQAFASQEQKIMQQIGEEAASLADESLLVFGVFLSTVLALTTYLAQVARQRMKAVTKTNELYILEIAERKHVEKALQASEKRYRTLYDDNPSMIFTVDEQGTMLSVNQHGAAQLGYSINQLVGEPVLKVFHEDDAQTAAAALQRCFAEPGVVHRWELRKIHKDGPVLWVRETGRAVANVDDRQTVLIVCEDITKTRQLSEELSYQASHDALTDLINRREFEQRLQRVLKTAWEEQSEHALCYLDLDQFKVINDTCGHVAGDELLRQLGSVLQGGVVRKRDTLARLGGDEFGVLMEHCNLQQAKRVANTLRKGIEGFRFAWEGRHFTIGVSMGLVPITDTSLSTTEILQQADAACYAAKDAGRNRVHVYQVADTELARRHGEMQWVARINQALEEDRFCLYAQPIVPIACCGRGKDHYEILLRMRDESDELVPPGAFLVAAERYGLATRLDRWVIDTCLNWLAANPAHMQELSQCAINLSGLSLGDSQFLDYVVARFEETVIPPEKICFEITETAAITNLSDAMVFINTLKDLGCRFALDDFGSGLSSFAYLKTLPVDYLKIDGVFVKDIATDPIDFEMVKSINDIGKVMGKQTIAEFVESEAILDKLRTINVNYAQGYAIARPQPLENMLSVKVSGK